jgi:hypothetical protein
LESGTVWVKATGKFNAEGAEKRERAAEGYGFAVIEFKMEKRCQRDGC